MTPERKNSEFVKSQFPGSRSAISGHRYYNPQLGRFLGRDSSGEKGGLHLYAFCRNNVVNLYDILGLSGSSPSWTDQYLISQGLDPNGGKDAALVSQNQQIETQMVAKYGNMNSGGAGTAGMTAEMPGDNDMTLYSVSSGNSVSDWESTLTFTKTYVVGGQSYTISNDPHAAPDDSSTAFNVNANTGQFSAIANGNVNIGEIANLGTVGDEPLVPASQPKPSAGLPVLTASDYVPVPYTNPYNQQPLFNAIGQNMQSSGLGQTLSNGATLGEIGTVAGVILPPAAVVAAPAIVAAGNAAVAGGTWTVAQAKAAADVAAFRVGLLLGSASGSISSGEWLSEQPYVQAIIDGEVPGPSTPPPPDIPIPGGLP